MEEGLTASPSLEGGVGEGRTLQVEKQQVQRPRGVRLPGVWEPQEFCVIRAEGWGGKSRDRHSG